MTETGWGGFDIQIKIYYDPIANEKAQTFWHTLALQPWGSEQQIEQQIRDNEVKAWVYDEMVFNEPYEQFYEVLTNPIPKEKSTGGKGKATRTMKGGMVASVGERTALIPLQVRPGQPFSTSRERDEVKKLAEGKRTVDAMNEKLRRELKEKEDELKRLKAEIEKLS